MQRFDGALGPMANGLHDIIGPLTREQVWVAIFVNFSLPATEIAIQTKGVIHVLFANDHPFFDAQHVRDYAQTLNNVVGPADMPRSCRQTSRNCSSFMSVLNYGSNRKTNALLTHNGQ